ncbi:aldo/keto reductase [Eubacterium sp.]
MQYREDKNGEKLSILGYGCMRFTKKGNSIDIDKAEKEIMEAYNQGVNYYDTAYIYSGSEAALGEIVEKNNIRDKIKIATKLPQYLIGNGKGLDKYFNEELSRLKTDYVDYYLMHHLTDVAMWEKLKAVGILEWIEKKKKEGSIRNIGFSY